MRFLFMNSTLVSNLEPLAEMRRLLILDGSMNRITDVTPLWDMRDLNYLNLSGNLNLQDIEPLIDCVGLEDLDISGTAVTDLSPLYYMTDLDLIVSPRVKLHDLPIEFRQTNRITRRADPVSGAGYRSDLDDGAFELAIDLNE